MVKLSLATSALAEILGLEHSGKAVQVTGVSISAAEIEPGDLFVAVQGAKHHGLDFLAEAVAKGAVAVLSDRPNAELPYLLAADPKALLGEVCNLVLGESPLTLYAITGTNGKTSTASYLFELLENLGDKPGLSGSTGLHSAGESKTSALTTSELTTTRKFLTGVERAGGKSAVIEVSAQAMVRNRVSGLKFAVAGFTNLSRDHMDDFGSMDAYFEAKSKLFDAGRVKRAVVFVSDDWSKRLAASLKIPALLLGQGQEVDYRYESGFLTLSGKLNLSIPFEFGELMARNFALALTMLFSQGFGVDELQAATGKISQVPGRLELVSDATPHTYVDYAHTPDGIASAVAELKTRYPGVTVLFGASGNRDVGKRAQMGAAAAAATQVVVTDQHPRDEDPAAIRAAVIQGLTESKKSFHEVAGPEQALQFALGITPRDHALLWCGPGHLKYREIAGQKVPFDARAIAKLAVEQA
jgi:UDP-N-acetylmuramoyl-L-alanyl-D-glutamate--2,6-diaminopimelate ligase